MKRFPLIAVIVLCFTANLPATPAMLLVDRRQTATALDTVILRDTSRKTQTSRPVSISRIFRSGEISQFAQAVVDRGVGPVLTQCDVKSRWPNGSLKHAIVSFTLPAIAPGKPVTVSFQNQASGNNNNPLSPAKMLAANFNFDAQIRLTGRASAIISARTMLKNGAFTYWLQGPIVTAVIIEDRLTRLYDVNTDNKGNCPARGGPNCPLHPQFEAWFYPQSNAVEIGYTLENTWISSTVARAMRDQDYSLTLTVGSSTPKTVLTQSSFRQIGRSRWHHAAWINQPLGLHVDYNAAYEVSTGGFPDWDTSFKLAPALIRNYHAAFTASPERLIIPGNDGGVGNVVKNVNGGGQHDYVGLANLLDVLYFLSMDDTLRADMLINASRLGRIPYHYREADSKAGSGHFFDNAGRVDTQGRVVSVNARTQLTLMQNGFNRPDCGGPRGADLVSLGTTSFDGWIYDASHFPSIGFMSYLLSGKYYFLEELQYEAAYMIGEKPGCVDSTGYTRQGAEGYLNQSQLRGEAWGLRTIGYCAFASPDNTPEQTYCFDKLKNNISRWEGALSGEPISQPSYKDKQREYNWGRLSFNGSDTPPPTNPNSPPFGVGPLHLLRPGDPVFVQNPVITPVGCGSPGCLRYADSPWEISFFGNTIGLLRNQGFKTTAILARVLHLYVNEALNTGKEGMGSPYYLDTYRIPTILQASGNWIQTWPEFTRSFAVQPAGSAPNGYQVLDDTTNTVDDAHGFQAMCVLSYGTDLTIDGYSVLTAYNTVRQNHPYQEQFATASPKWDCVPISNSSTAAHPSESLTENTAATDAVTGTKTSGGPQTHTRSVTETYRPTDVVCPSINGVSRCVGWKALANTTLTTSGVCPPNYYGGDTFNFATACPTSITAQSGGFVDTDHNQICVWGEGHNDGYGNEVMCVDLTAKPPAWKLRTNPTIPTNCQAASNVAGGLCPGFTPAHNACIGSIPPQNPWPISGTPGTDCLTTGGTNCAPNARHSYSNLGYMPGFGAFLHSGVAACQAGGSGITDTWIFDTKANHWSSPPLKFVHTEGNKSMPVGNSGVRITAWDSFNKLMWVHTGSATYGSQNGTNGYLFTFDPSSNTYDLRLNDDYVDLYLEAVVDPVDHYLFMFGPCAYNTCSESPISHYGIIRWDISKPSHPLRKNLTNSVTTCDPLWKFGGNMKPTDINLGLAWDPVWRLIVAWPNFGGSIYLFNPASENVNTPFGNIAQNTCLKVGQEALGTGPPDSANASGQPGSSYGTYHRFDYLPSLDEFVLINGPSSNVYVLRLR